MTCDKAASSTSATLLRNVAERFGGRVPNLYRMLATNPAALQAYVDQKRALEEAGSLTAAEQALVALDVAVRADCSYCTQVFVKEARSHGIAEETIRAVRQGAIPEALRDRVLVRATRRVAATHGRLGRDEIADLEEAGLPLGEILEIIALIAAYTLASYTNNLVRTRVDPEFRIEDPEAPA